MRGLAHLCWSLSYGVINTVKKQQPYPIIKRPVVPGVSVRELAFSDLSHFIAVGNHAWLRNPTNHPRLEPWNPVCPLKLKKPRVRHSENMEGKPFALPGSLVQPRRSVWGGPRGRWPPYSSNVTLWKCSRPCLTSGVTGSLWCHLYHVLLHSFRTVYLGPEPRQRGQAEGWRFELLTQKGPAPFLMCYPQGSMKSQGR